MIFYRFKGNDDLWLGKYGKNQNTLIPNELKTEKEIENIKATSPRLSIDKAFERIDIPKSDTYTSFGVRFQYGYDHNGKTESIKRSATKVMINEAESYGWVVEDYQAQEAYEFACDYFGEDELNSQIVSCISNEELASCLAYIFRMNDFREWEESLENQDVDESIEHPNWMDDDVGFDIPWDENGFDIPKSAKDKSNKSAYWRDRRYRLNGNRDTNESCNKSKKKSKKPMKEYAGEAHGVIKCKETGEEFGYSSLVDREYIISDITEQGYTYTDKPVRVETDYDFYDESLKESKENTTYVVFRKYYNEYTDTYEPIAFYWGNNIPATYGSINVTEQDGNIPYKNNPAYIHDEADIRYISKTKKLTRNDECYNDFTKFVLDELSEDDYNVVVKQKVDYDAVRNSWKR